MFQLHKTLKQDRLENNYFFKNLCVFPLAAFFEFNEFIAYYIQTFKKN